MLKKIMLLISIFIFTCCQQSTDIDDFPDDGKASVTIDNQDYIGVAYLSSKNVGEFDFTSINLEFDDSTNIEILCEDFKKGIFSCDPTQALIFSMEYAHKPFYIAKEGILNLKKVTSEQIVGEFKVVVFDASSSCKDCPGTLKQSEGKFNAIKM